MPKSTFDALKYSLAKEIAKITQEREQLHRDRANFEQWKEKISAVHFPQRVKLSIGGTVFSTSLETLRKDKDSMLAAMFSGKGFKVEPDEDGAYFIDRDGTQFRHVVNYLLSGKVFVPESPNDLAELMEELDFYQISGYLKALKQLTERKEFVFVAPEDTNGILYWLGTNEGKGSYNNPYTSARIKVTSSPEVNGHSTFGRSQTCGGICSEGTHNYWFAVELPYAVCLHYYTASHGGCCKPRNWKIEGSVDSKAWTLLRSHKDDSTFQSAKFGHWSLPPNEYYKHFRWTVTGHDWSSERCYCLHLSGIELYGFVQLQ